MRLRAASSLLHLIAISAAAQAPASRGVLATGTYAITNVAVVPMTSDTVIRDATVIVRDGRIAEVGPGRGVRVPADVRRIDGTGKFLIPGLADMHTHLYSDGETPDSVAPYELGVMVANGVTTTRLMIGTAQHLALRRDVALGRVLGPKLWVASPQFAGKEEENGVVVATPEQARAAVRRVVDAGYDFVKLTTDITPEVYDAVTEEAMRTASGCRPCRSAGRGAARAGGRPAHRAPRRLLRVGDGRLGAIRPFHLQLRDLQAEELGDARPHRRCQGGSDRQGDGEGRGLVHAHPAPLQHRVRNRGDRRGDAEPGRLVDDHPASPTALPGRAHQVLEAVGHRSAPDALRRGTQHAHEEDCRGGGKMIAGSDTPEWLMVYRWEIHREIEAFVAAGLTPYQALQTATTTPAEFLKATDWGTVQQGMRADLVLLAGNPLDDIRNTARIEAVAVGGRWIPRGELERMIATATSRLDGDPPDPSAG